MNIKNIIGKSFLILDGAMGTLLQSYDLKESDWDGKVGCNEILNITRADIIKNIHLDYLKAGADITKTNSFGALPWVLEEYNLQDKTYEIAKQAAINAQTAKNELQLTENKSKFIAGSLGPGTKLASLNQIDFDIIHDGYFLATSGLIDGGVDLILLETFQDPLQIKAALNGCFDAIKYKQKDIPIMVSATIELNGSMLIGTDVATLAAILEPFDILSLGLNCGSGPIQVETHLKKLSQHWHGYISIHSNAGLPENVCGKVCYPMDPESFAIAESKFCDIDGVSIIGGCCGTTPRHIKTLSEKIKNLKPKPPKGKAPQALASLYQYEPLFQEPPPFLVGERTNATGSKQFRDLLLKEDYDSILSIAQEQVLSGAKALDVSVNFAGRDEEKDMVELISRFNQKISIPLMVDSTQPNTVLKALKLIGGRPIINSANLEDGVEKFDKTCELAKRFGSALVLLAIDEKGMAKTKKRKVEVAYRMLDRALKNGLKKTDLVFDLLTFTVASAEEEYRNAAKDTIDAIKELRSTHKEVGAILGISNVSFGLDPQARKYLNSVFLYHAVKNGLSMAIVNPKSLIPYPLINQQDKRICERLIFNDWQEGDPLIKFIEHFSENKKSEEKETLEDLPLEEKIKKLLISAQTNQLIETVDKVLQFMPADKIIADLLIEAMKTVGNLFGEGKMQLPFVLASAESMKKCVDYLNQFMDKKKKDKQLTLVLGTVKGDVHDVGKNLVDIILTNNGYKVINLGTRVEAQTFIKAAKEHNADCIGMSGLLVKSTIEMKNNIEEFEKNNLKIPVLLGGAALNSKFVEDYCKPIYSGSVFYCKDAFDGLKAMSIVESEKNLKINKKVRNIPTKAITKEIDPYDIVLPKAQNVPKAPFFGRRVFVSNSLPNYNYIQNLAFNWINKTALFVRAWGYKKANLAKEEYDKLTKEEILPNFENLKQHLIEQNIFEPLIIYGYFACRSDSISRLKNGDTKKAALYIFDESTNELTKNLEFEQVKNSAKLVMDFERVGHKPYLCLADYFRNDINDIVAFSLVSAGSKFSKFEKTLFKNGEYKKYHLIHGLGIELTESLAEIIHKHIRIELGITNNESRSLEDVNFLMKSYQGARYSPGYPSCPDLSLNDIIFSLLRAYEYGVKLTENHQIVPEQSTVAIILHHKEAIYF
ncbi:5-methyltetrahydrofolate--homocysteine methyltransferase [Desulfurella amilsii]|uniref:Methionine synthase n=1 Tax=Desulfurella amilsii TaxID=1562698 RepID=A0A1X4XUR2_9BACT|nr:methionine synthase [Desulfurella amilsii]OSS41276.1 5-methyltetrahydrofolate--homocysteine methyltransferase [Desulfurella amilsii]